VGSEVSTIIDACRTYALALITADGGELYVVSAANNAVHLHLAGTCGGCPGAQLTEATLLRPVVRQALPNATLTVTSGWTIPSNATRVAPV
jgi:Fe-S cluster biogenesis protein NfuA